MGCYGIGTSRLMGVIVEKFHDDKGIICPSVAPFNVHLLALKGVERSRPNLEDLLKRGVEVLYDDRETSAGVKFADSDLIGIPYRALAPNRSDSKRGSKKRSESEARLVKFLDLADLIKIN